MAIKYVSIPVGSDVYDKAKELANADNRTITSFVRNLILIKHKESCANPLTKV